MNEKTKNQEQEINSNNSTATKKRVPIFKRKAYDYSSIDFEPGFHYHWANGTEKNMYDFESAGYTQVIDKNGVPVTRRGTNDINKQFLMRIPEELYNEDQRAKLNEPKEIEMAMGLRGTYANKIVSEGNMPYSYIPKNGMIQETEIGGKIKKI